MKDLDLDASKSRLDRVIAIRSDSRESLIDTIMTLRGLRTGMTIRMGTVTIPDIDWTKFPAPFLKVALPCGCVREWQHPADIPDFSIVCRCGDLPYEHYFILYDKQEQIKFAEVDEWQS